VIDSEGGGATSKILPLEPLIDLGGQSTSQPSSSAPQSTAQPQTTQDSSNAADSSAQEEEGTTWR